MKPKIIFLDWNGTLSDSKFWGHLQDTGLYDQIESSLFGNLRHLIKPWMRGEYRTEDIVENIANDTGLDQEYLLKEFILSCQQMYIPQLVLESTNKLRQNGKKVYIATDNMDSFNRWTIPALNLLDHFDGILNSWDIKALKGDFSGDGKNLFFGKFLSQNKLTPRDCVLIDDGEDKENIIGQFGIKYLKIDKSTELVEVLNRLL